MNIRYKPSSSSKQKKHIYFCRRNVDPQTTVGLHLQQQKQQRNKQVTIQYLGLYHPSTGKYDQVAASKLIPVVLQSQDEQKNDHLDGEYLQQYERMLQKASSNNKPERILAEVMIVRRIVDQVRAQQQAAAAAQLEQEKEQQQQKKKQQQLHPPPPELVASTQSDNEEQVSSSDDSDSDDDSVDSYTTRLKKKEPLRAGDTIQYYHPTEVAGRRDRLITSKVLSVDPKHRSFPLVLDNGDLIPRDHPVQISKRLLRNKEVEHRKGLTQPIEKFKLMKSGTWTHQDAIQRKADRYKSIRSEVDAAGDAFWQNTAATSTTSNTTTSAVDDNDGDDDEGNENQNEHNKSKKKTSKVSSKRSASKKTPPSTPDTPKHRISQKKAASTTQKRKLQLLDDTTSSDENGRVRKRARRRESQPDPIPHDTPKKLIQRPPPYKAHLVALQKESQQRLANASATTAAAESNRGRRSRRAGPPPHLTLDQINLCLQTWRVLEDIHSSSSRNSGAVEEQMEAFAEDLGEEHELPPSAVQKFLRGDKDQTLQLKMREDITSALQDYHKK